MSETQPEVAEEYETITIMGDTKLVLKFTDEDVAEHKEAEQLYREELEMLSQRQERQASKPSVTVTRTTTVTHNPAPQQQTKANPPHPQQTKAS